MIAKLHFGTGVTVKSPVSSAYVEITAVYYDKEYQEIVVKLPDQVTDLAANAPESLWDALAPKIEEAINKQTLIDMTELPLFRTVSREYILLHWKPYDVDACQGNDPFAF